MIHLFEFQHKGCPMRRRFSLQSALPLSACLALCLLPGQSLAEGSRHGFFANKQAGSLFGNRAPAGDTHTDSARVLRDLAYGNADKQKLDVYLPSAPRAAPIIVMVHGGAWFIGDKQNSGVVSNKVEYWVDGKGYLLVSVNYRLVPEANALEQAHDVAKALAYVQRHAASWGGNPQQIVIMGHSAGAHLVGLLGANPKIATQNGAQPWRGTIVLDSAAMDIVSVMKRKHHRFYDRAFGEDENLWRAASPLQQLNAGATPMLVVCSEQRGDKPCVQGEQFVRKAKSLGVSARLLPQDKGHGSINKDLGADPAYSREVDSFIRQVLSHP